MLYITATMTRWHMLKCWNISWQENSIFLIKSKLFDPRIKIPYVLFTPTLSISKTQFWYLNYVTFYFIYGSYILTALLLFGNWYRKRKIHWKCNMFNKIFESSHYVILCHSYKSININRYIMHSKIYCWFLGCWDTTGWG